MKVNAYSGIITDVYELLNKKYDEAYYDLADIFEEYLDYLGKK